MSGTRVEKMGPWGGPGGQAFDLTARMARIKIHHLNAIRGLEFQYEINGVLRWSPLWGCHKDSKITESGTRVEKMGPWGGPGGRAFDLTGCLARIKIHHLNAIRGLEFQYEINGVLRWSPLWGCHKDSKITEIVLEKGEFLSSISGHTGSSEGYYVITSLTLISNIRKYGPYGTEIGSPFGLPETENTRIIGFHGRAAGLLDSIGVYLETYPGGASEKDFANVCEELSKKLAEVTTENNALKDEAKYHIKVREALGKMVAKLSEEKNSLKVKLENTISLRILSKMDESYCLAARQDGSVVFVQSNTLDKYQLWHKYMRYDSNLKDAEGIPCFAIVNKATLEAIQYRGPRKPVGLVPYDPDTVDASVLWTEGKDTGEGFHYVRSVNNIRYIWDAFTGNTELHEGVELGIYNILEAGKDFILGKTNQLWKIQQWA